MMDLKGTSFNEALERCRHGLKEEDWATLIWTILGETAAGALIRSGGGRSFSKRRKGIRNRVSEHVLPLLEDWLSALAENPQLVDKIIKGDGTLVSLGQDSRYDSMVRLTHNNNAIMAFHKC